MTFSNNPHLRRYLMDGGLAHLAVFASFEFPAVTFDERLIQVRAQHPYLDDEEAAARAAYRMLAAQAKRHKSIAKIKKRLGIRFWIIVAAIVISGLLAGYFCAAHAEPNAQQMKVIRNAMRGVWLLPAAQQGAGLIVQFRNGGSTLATRPAGLVVLDCTTNMTCSFSGNTFTITSSATGSTAWSAITAGTNAGQALLIGNGSSFAPTGSGTITSTAFTPAGTLDNCVKWGSGGALADFGAACGGGGAPAFTSITTGTNTTATMTVGTGGTLTFSGSGVLNADRINGVEFTNAESLGKIPIGQGDGTAVWADPLVQGLTSHDAAGSTTNPVAVGGYASAAAPTDVSADTDITRAWFLRNGAQVFNLASGGTLVTLGQKAMSASLPVVLASDQSALAVTGTFWQTTQPVSAASLPLPSGASTLAEQQTQTTALQSLDNIVSGSGVNVSQINGVTPLMGNGATGTGSPRVTLVNDNTNVPQIGGSATGSAVPSAARYVGGNGGGNLVGYLNCNGYAKDRSSTADVQLVAISGSTTIYVCGYSITSSSSTTNDINLRSATSSNCTTSAADVTPPRTYQAATSTGPIGNVVMTPGFTGLNTGASRNLCVHRSAAVTSEVEVWYSQF